MVSTISFIEANPQHSTAASRIITRTVSVIGIDMALIQELWYHEDCIKGLNIPGYTLYSAGGTERTRACILVVSMTSWMLPGFSWRNLVAVLVRGSPGRISQFFETGNNELGAMNPPFAVVIGWR
jgi:hypothetical protein